MLCSLLFPLFFFNDTATTEIYTLSLHDALPICSSDCSAVAARVVDGAAGGGDHRGVYADHHGCRRSEEHTSELQSRSDLVCRLLLEKKKKESQNHCNSHQAPVSAAQHTWWGSSV